MRHPKNLEYRNKVDLVSSEGISVDAGSLWVFKNDLLVLVDDDQYATHKLTNDFTELKNLDQ
tara:strand:- start:1883 stop:2068 length:186 start_codon:yes stop_codon:yes gene_type:complete